MPNNPKLPPIMEAAGEAAQAIVARLQLASGQEHSDAVLEIQEALIRFGHTVTAEAERATLKRIAK